MKIYGLFRALEDGSLTTDGKEAKAMTAASAARKLGLDDWFEGPGDTAYWEDLRVIPEELW